ncbi:phenolic acid decarboxylase [Streptosporangium sp. H16]|uniref:phenolic acid decarboxylase n=1 Tax=Streptosporangium sp. H16 TaxID=3444184 RepID=UPI003F78D689
MTPELVGRTFAADLGRLKVKLTYDTDSKMTFVVTSGAAMVADGHTETVEVEIVEIRPRVYLVSWQEATGATVVHVEDLEHSIVHSTVTLDGRLYRLAGTFTEV